MLTKKNVVAAEFFRAYIGTAPDEQVLKAIGKNTRAFIKLLEKVPGKKYNYAYAEGKWTIKELLQHIIDAERVFCYRALRFARKDAAPLSGFDENSWAQHARASERSWKDLVGEFKALRSATEYLFASFNEEEFLSKGIASGHEINVLALGYITAGHVQHHLQILRERYL